MASFFRGKMSAANTMMMTMARKSSSSSLLLSIAAALMIMLMMNVVFVADAATYSVQYMQTLVPVPYTMTSMWCDVNGMTLPIIDSADKQTEFLNFIASNKALNSLGSSSAITFLNGGITTNCSSSSGTNNNCRMYRVNENGSNTTLAYLNSNGNIVSTVSGEYNNYVRSSSTPSILVFMKNGNWQGEMKDFKVPAIVCEKKVSTNTGGNGNGTPNTPNDASSNMNAVSSYLLAATVYLATILLFIIYA